MSERGYPSDWGTRRKRVYERNNHKCTYCSRIGGPEHGRELHAHHVVPIAEGGSHDLSNLVALCEDCHQAVHTSKQFLTPVDEMADTFRQQLSETAGSVSSHSSVAGEYLNVLPNILKAIEREKAKFQGLDPEPIIQEMSSEANIASNLRKQTVNTKLHANQLERMADDSEYHVHVDHIDLNEYILTVKKMMELTIEMLDTIDMVYNDLEAAASCTNCDSVDLTRDIVCANCGGSTTIDFDNDFDFMSDHESDFHDIAERTVENDEQNAKFARRLAEQS